MIVTDYNDVGFSHARAATAVKRITAKLKCRRKKVGLVFTGISGVLIGMRVVDKTKRPFAIVRKNERSHSTLRVEGHEMREFIIIDDFIEYGHTIDLILRKMKRFSGRSQCVGIFLYNARGDKYDDFRGIPVTVL